MGVGVPSVLQVMIGVICLVPSAPHSERLQRPLAVSDIIERQRDALGQRRIRRRTCRWLRLGRLFQIPWPTSGTAFVRR
jgi:hypothetical protein